MTYVELLDKTLEEAVDRSVNGVDDLALLFSGGLDSSLLAKIALDQGVEPILISVHMPGSRDESHIKEAAHFFDLELIEKSIFPEEIPLLTETVMRIIGSENPLDVSIGVAFYGALEMAAWSGLKNVICGQGADELFAGYHRYLKMSPERLEKALKEDVENINIGRDMALATSLDIQLFTPYLDENVVSLGLNIPVEWKIRDGTRKYILRKVATKRGLPESIWAREKKAIQYSTGVDKMVRKILKNG